MTTPAAPSRANRRLTARKACLLSVRYRTKGGWHPATALDLSAGGCRLRVGEDLGPGTRVEVTLETAPLDDGGRVTAEVSGAVTWCHLDGLSHSAGIQFDPASAALEQLLSAIP
jgi:hypothetical protein